MNVCSWHSKNLSAIPRFLHSLPLYNGQSSSYFTCCCEDQAISHQSSPSWVIYQNPLQALIRNTDSWAPPRAAASESSWERLGSECLTRPPGHSGLWRELPAGALPQRPWMRLSTSHPPAPDASPSPVRTFLRADLTQSFLHGNLSPHPQGRGPALGMGPRTPAQPPHPPPFSSLQSI